MTDEVTNFDDTGQQQIEETHHEPESEVIQAHALQDEDSKPPTLWQMIRSNLGLMSQAQRDRQLQYRLKNVDDAIDLYPQAASNYVLRGEILLELGHDDLAENDFRRALELITPEVEQSTWGVVAQGVQDRAEHGLRKVRQNR